MSSKPKDDRTTLARIRDAAIECLAAEGVARSTVRGIAMKAGVSPALVIHHYGSMDNLRVVCDEYVVAFIRQQKIDAMAQGASLDPLAALRASAGGPPVVAYLAKTVIDGSPHVTELVREMIEDAVGYLKTGQETGLIQPLDDARGCAAVLTIWSLGALVLHEQVKAVLGVDLLSTSLAKDPLAIRDYSLPSMELMSGGLLTPEAYQNMKAAFDAAASESNPSESDRESTT